MPSNPSEDTATRYATVFAAPLLTRVCEDAVALNADLKARILAHEAENTGVGKSNKGGWHSETGELAFCGAAGSQLIKHMRSLADEGTQRVLAEHRRQSTANQWTVHAWANVNRSGDFNSVHVHPGSTWSGTYYVDTGDPLDAEGGTPLQLFDPCQGRSTTFLSPLLPESIFIRPRPGLIVMFPSYIPHMVFPHKGNAARISIAFNLRREPFP